MHRTAMWMNLQVKFLTFSAHTQCNVLVNLNHWPCDSCQTVKHEKFDNSQWHIAQSFIANLICKRWPCKLHSIEHCNAHENGTKLSHMWIVLSVMHACLLVFAIALCATDSLAANTTVLSEQHFSQNMFFIVCNKHSCHTMLMWTHEFIAFMQQFKWSRIVLSNCSWWLQKKNFWFRTFNCAIFFSPLCWNAKTQCIETRVHRWQSVPIKVFFQQWLQTIFLF